MPTISIVTTTYKHEKYIQYTIDSILHQSFSDWELLIWDDSPDNATWDIIQKYTKKYPDKIKAWHHHPNKGIVDNMNFLIEKSHPNSQYIAFLEWDDLYTPDNLEKKLHIFNQYSEVQMVYNNLDFIDGEGKVFEKDFFRDVERILQNEKLPLEDFISKGIYYESYSSIMVRKNIFAHIQISRPIDKPMYMTSDWEFFGIVANYFFIYGITESLTQYRRHESNTSSNMITLTEDVILSINRFIKSGYVKSTRRVLYKLYHLKTYIAYLQGNRCDTIFYWLQSFRYSLRKNFLERAWMITFSLLPKKINNFLYKKLKK